MDKNGFKAIGYGKIKLTWDVPLLCFSRLYNSDGDNMQPHSAGYTDTQAT